MPSEGLQRVGCPVRACRGYTSKSAIEMCVHDFIQRGMALESPLNFETTLCSSSPFKNPAETLVRVGT